MVRLVCHSSAIERRPALAAQQAARDSLQVALVGELQNERSARANDPASSRMSGPGIPEVVKHSDADRDVEGGVREGQREGIAEADLEPGVVAQRLARHRDVDLGGVEKNDLS